MVNPFISPSTQFHKTHTKNGQSELSKAFHGLNINKYNQDLSIKPQRYWISQGEEKALNLFHLAAQHVPAYKDFLKQHKISHDSIKSISDYRNVPTTNKANYISQYTLEQLSWQGKIESANIISLSSGTTNKPYLWPRSSYQDYEGAFQFEHLLTYLFQIDKTPTLLVNCFSMGNYVAGTYVLSSTKLVTQKGYPLTVITPGINYKDVLYILKHLEGKFEQTIICGYPPFIRDIIDIGNSTGFDFKNQNFKFFYASEFFSEVWRDYTLSLTGSRNPFTDSTNIYGTADSAIFSFETPAAILIRKLAQHNQKLNQDLFSTKLSPTLTQYNPLLTYLETIDRELHLTTNSGLPLIRYNLRDNGSTLKTNHIKNTLKKHGINFSEELARHNIQDTLNNLPFAYVTNRSDNAVSFYAINIFPEFVRSGIESNKLKKLLTGKCTLISSYNEQQLPQLIIHVELNSQTQPSTQLNKIVQQSVVKSLRRNCSEYRFLESSIGKRSLPIIKLHPYKKSKYFKVGIKQKWLA